MENSPLSSFEPEEPPVDPEELLEELLVELLMTSPPTDMVVSFWEDRKLR
jgi:hypothetical protein